MSKSRTIATRKSQPQVIAPPAKINGVARLPLILPKPPSSNATNPMTTVVPPNANCLVNGTKQRGQSLKRRRKTTKLGKVDKPVVLDNNIGLSPVAQEGAKAKVENGAPSTATDVINQTALTGAECQANYEEFVRTFAVPTHLYRYLASRHRVRPTYLTRNLRYMQSTGCGGGGNKGKETLDEVVSRLSSIEAVQSCGSSRSRRSVKSASSASGVGSTGLSGDHQWPDEIEIIMEGFFDSEKENDWVTVESSVNLFCRTAWTWRRNSRPLDSLVLISRNVACVCNGESPAASTATLPPLVPSARFRLVDVLRIAAAMSDAPPTEALVSSICSRISSAQLELQVNVIERRRARHINGTEAGDPLGQTAYPVVYSTSSLPLFFSPDPGSTASAFLLTPGLYELRLGIQAAPIPIPDDCGILPVALISRSLMAFEGGTPTASNGDHRVTFLGPSSSSSSFTPLKFSKNPSCAALDEYSRWPRLRFRVIWHSLATSSPFSTSVPRPLSIRGARCTVKRPLSEAEGPPPSKIPCTHPHEEGEAAKIDEDESNNSGFHSSLTSSTSLSIEVVYLFFYGGDEKRILQWTKTRDMICPWCKVDCRRGDKVYPSCLMAHLRCCHPRFRFSGSWQRETNHLLLEVTLDESYDGSNDCIPRAYRPSTESAPESGVDICLAETAASRNPCHLPIVGGWTGYCGEAENNLRDARKIATSRFLQRRRRQPLKRLPFSQLIYWRGVERFSGSSHELSGEMASMSAAAAAAMAVGGAATGPVEVGHKRTYFHTTTLQLIEPTTFDDCDSEDDDAPQWLRDHYQRKVEEFTDVNKGEKEFMQIWNAFLLSVKPSETVVCDNQIGPLLFAFVQRFGVRLHQRHLRNNFILHLANLYDYGLVAPSLMRKIICAFDDIEFSST